LITLKIGRDPPLRHLGKRKLGIHIAKPRNTIDRLAGELKRLSEQLAPRVDLRKTEIDEITRKAWLAGEDFVLHGGPGDNLLFLSSDLQRRASLAILLANRFPDELSQEFLEDKLTGALFQLKGKQGDELWASSRKWISDFIAEVQSLSVQHEVIFPIVNLVLPAGPLHFGPVTLYPRGEDDLMAEVTRDLDHPLLRSAGLKAVNAYGTATVRARDQAQIQSKALESAENAFNVIRLFRSYESYRWYGIIKAVAVQESALRIVWLRAIDDTLPETEQPHARMIGSLGAGAPFTIRPDGLAYMRRKRFDEIVSLCFSTPLDDVHRRIRDSVRWAGQAKITRDNQARFLGQWIALEILLNPYERNPVGRDVSDAAAFLLSKPEVETRLWMAGHFRKFWITRNIIMHKGAPVSENDCEALASDVTRAVTALTYKHGAGVTDIQRWFESQKYSTIDDTPPVLGR